VYAHRASRRAMYAAFWRIIYDETQEGGVEIFTCFMDIHTHDVDAVLSIS